MDTIAFGVGVRKVSWPDGYLRSALRAEKTHIERLQRKLLILQELLPIEGLPIADDR